MSIGTSVKKKAGNRIEVGEERWVYVYFLTIAREGQVCPSYMLLSSDVDRQGGRAPQFSRR